MRRRLQLSRWPKPNTAASSTPKAVNLVAATSAQAMAMMMMLHHHTGGLTQKFNAMRESTHLHGGTERHGSDCPVCLRLGMKLHQSRAVTIHSARTSRLQCVLPEAQAPLRGQSSGAQGSGPELTPAPSCVVETDRAVNQSRRSPSSAKHCANNPPRHSTQTNA